MQKLSKLFLCVFSLTQMNLILSSEAASHSDNTIMALKIHSVKREPRLHNSNKFKHKKNETKNQNSAQPIPNYWDPPGRYDGGSEPDPI
jgi:hypothetical protein